MKGVDDCKAELKGDNHLYLVYFIALEKIGCLPSQLLDVITEQELIYIAAYLELKADRDREAMNKK